MNKTMRQVYESELLKQETRKQYLQNIVFASPLSEILELRKQLSDKIEAGEDKGSDFMEWLGKSSKKEKELFKIAKEQEKSSEYISEIAKIDMLISKLNNKIYYGKGWDNNENM